MSPQDAIDLTRDAIYLSLLISAPVLLVGMAVALGIGLLQAITQVQDQTVSFVPKIVGMVVALTLTLPWVLNQMLQYSKDLIQNIATRL